MDYIANFSVRPSMWHAQGLNVNVQYCLLSHHWKEKKANHVKKNPETIRLFENKKGNSYNDKHPWVDKLIKVSAESINILGRLERFAQLNRLLYSLECV